MPHSVAPVNAAANNKSKVAFRLPTVREDHKEEGIRGFFYLSKCELHDGISNKNHSLPFVFFSTFVLFV
jgi:hypothetical protein